jgi:hypothetical protein
MARWGEKPEQGKDCKTQPGETKKARELPRARTAAPRAFWLHVSQHQILLPSRSISNLSR